MLWLRALAVWIVLMTAESLHGMLRALWLVPRIGDLPARQVGVFTGAGIVLVLSIAFAPWLNSRSVPRLLSIGAGWVALTVSFEFGIGRAVFGLSWDRLWSDYDLSRGGLMPLGLIVMLLAPMIASNARAAMRIDQKPHK